jgi:hypothetical protein
MTNAANTTEQTTKPTTKPATEQPTDASPPPCKCWNDAGGAEEAHERLVQDLDREIELQDRRITLVQKQARCHAAEVELKVKEALVLPDDVTAMVDHARKKRSLRWETEIEEIRAEHGRLKVKTAKALSELMAIRARDATVVDRLHEDLCENLTR